MKTLIILISTLFASAMSFAQTQRTISPKKVSEVQQPTPQKEVNGQLLVALKKELAPIYQKSSSFEDFIKRVESDKKTSIKNQKEQTRILQLVYDYLKNNTSDANIIKNHPYKTIETLRNTRKQEAFSTDFFWKTDSPNSNESSPNKSSIRRQ